MLPRVQTAVDVQKAIDRASVELDEIGFDASVLKAGYYEIQGTLEDFADRCPSPDPNETTLVVPGGGIIDKTQMVRHLSNYRAYV